MEMRGGWHAFSKKGQPAIVVVLITEFHNLYPFSYFCCDIFVVLLRWLIFVVFELTCLLYTVNDVQINLTNVLNLL